MHSSSLANGCQLPHMPSCDTCSPIQKVRSRACLYVWSSVVGDFRFLDAPTERSGHDVDLLVIGLSPKQLSSRIPMGRLGKVEEVADAAAFLAQNSYANNCVLTIDGGLSAGFFAS